MSHRDTPILHKSGKSFGTSTSHWNPNCSSNISTTVFSRFQLRVRPALIAVLCAFALPAATLEQLSLNQLSQSATSIVRATVADSYTTVINSTVYTHYTLRVAEAWKGVPAAEVLVPGGISGNLRQAFPGIPQLSPGSEYVLFLWKSSSTGITHLVGLSQGLFQVARQADGSALATRAQIGEMMLDASGKKVADRAITLVLSDMRTRVHLATSQAVLR